MSRIGRAPIAIPAGVTVTLAAGNTVTVKGPKGTLTSTFLPCVAIAEENGTIVVTRASDDKEIRAVHGLTRALIANMVEGVTNGYSKRLEIVGVGYRAEKQGKKLVLNLGYSHPVFFEEGNGITFEVPASNTIVVSGIDKQAVGQVAAQIREKRPPEPYLGKGIKYTGEQIRRKAGKTGK
jgi:large subunit ribosomal protein L6